MTVATKTPSIRAERAVFTSIRSPMGVGYQLVAKSAGITRAEKQEIVRAAPSHGNLCGDTDAAAGMASFTLGTGRQCLLLSLHAGAEQTARGGLRVQTHVLVLEPEHFARFDWNPLTVERKALAALDDGLRDIPTARLEPLVLDAPDAVDPPRAPDARGVASAVSLLLERRRTLVVGAQAPRDALQAVLLATPAIARRNLSLSYGVKFSPSRKFAFVVASASPAEQKRIAQARQVHILDWNAPDESVGGDGAGWPRFVEQQLETAQFRDLIRLAAALRDDGSPETLRRAVQLTVDCRRVAQAETAELDALARTYLDQPWRLPAYLLEDLRTAIAARRNAFKQAEETAAEEAHAVGIADNAVPKP